MLLFKARLDVCTGCKSSNRPIKQHSLLRTFTVSSLPFRSQSRAQAVSPGTNQKSPSRNEKNDPFSPRRSSKNSRRNTFLNFDLIMDYYGHLCDDGGKGVLHSWKTSGEVKWTDVQKFSFHFCEKFVVFSLGFANKYLMVCRKLCFMLYCLPQSIFDKDCGSKTCCSMHGVILGFKKKLLNKMKSNIIQI